MTKTLLLRLQIVWHIATSIHGMIIIYTLQDSKYYESPNYQVR